MSARRDRIRAVISDFGGVLTNQPDRGVRRLPGRDRDLGRAARPRHAAGRPSATASIRSSASSAARSASRSSSTTSSWGLEPELGHRPTLHRFREIYFEALHPNEPMLDLMRELRERGFRMAILTNNVREWEELWRSKLPLDEIFELIVDSAWVGMRKPDPEIYHLTIERLGDGLEPTRLPVRRRQRAERRGGPRAGHDRRALPLERAGDRGDPRGARRRPGPAALLVLGADAVAHVDLERRGAEALARRSSDSHGSTMSSASSSPTPARNASSPRKRAASLSTSRLWSPSPSNTPTRNSALATGVPDLERRVPGGEHREVLVIEVADGACVVLAQLLLGDVVDPGLDHLGEQRAPRLAAHRLGHHADRLGGLDEAEHHERHHRSRG